MQVRRLDHGVAVADQLHVEPGVGGDRHQVARGRRTRRRTRRRTARRPRVGRAARRRRVAGPRSRRRRRGSARPAPHDAGRGTRRGRSRAAALRTIARRRRRRRGPRARRPLGRSGPPRRASATRSGKRRPHPCHQRSVARRVAPRVQLHGAEPLRGELTDRLDVGRPRRRAGAPRRTTGAPARRPDHRAPRAAVTPARREARSHSAMSIVERTAGGNGDVPSSVSSAATPVAVVGVEADEPRHDRAERLDAAPGRGRRRSRSRRPRCPSAPESSVDPHQRRRREDLVGSIRVPEPLDVGSRAHGPRRPRSGSSPPPRAAVVSSVNSRHLRARLRA